MYCMICERIIVSCRDRNGSMLCHILVMMLRVRVGEELSTGSMILSLDIFSRFDIFSVAILLEFSTIGWPEV